MLEDKTDFKLKDLPICSIRSGQVYDGRAVLTCGGRIVAPDECIKCGREDKNKHIG